MARSGGESATENGGRRLRIGVAGWSIPPSCVDAFPATGTHLERYAARLHAVEINSSFYRPHRRTTYERWAESVQDGFRFAVKLPKTITHERRLVGCGDLLKRFADEVAGLGTKRGPVLVQLPPSFGWPGEPADVFFAELTEIVGGPVVLEPRHASWFTPEVDTALVRREVGRVAADPARIPAAAVPGGWSGVAYFRLHGSPEIYRSNYDEGAIAAQCEAATARVRGGAEVWVIYDNTTFGAATANALRLQAMTT